MADPTNKALLRSHTQQPLTKGALQSLPSRESPRSPRMTRQKKAIYTAIESAQRPLSFDEIKVGAEKYYKNVSERTIFRIIREMLDDNQLVKIALAGQPALYEPVTWEERPYFICTDCNQVFTVAAQTKSMFKPDALPRDVEIEGVEIVFRGKCSRCRSSSSQV